MALPTVRFNLIPTFPARVFGSGPIVITKAGLDYTFSWDASTYSLNPAPSGMAYVLSYDPSTGSTELIPVGGVAADWDSIVNKPATFPPSAHTHPISEVDGLQTALDDKLDDSQLGVSVAAATVTVTGGSGLSGGGNLTANRTITWDGVQVRKNSAGSTFTRRRVNLIEGTNVTLTVADDSGNDEVDVTIAASASTPNGAVINSAYAEYTANADLTTVIPFDDTIPTSSEGTEILSTSITPGSTTNKLRIRFHLWGINSGSNIIAAAALFTGGSSAVQVAAANMNGGGGEYSVISGEYEYTPGSTSSVTVSLRVGPSSGTMRLNGNTAGRLYGGASRCTLVVEEIKA